MRVFERIRNWWRGPAEVTDDELRFAYEALDGFLHMSISQTIKTLDETERLARALGDMLRQIEAQQ